MTDQEAEAALLALGPRLEWEPSRNHEHWWVCTNNPMYSIQPSSRIRDKNGLPYAYLAYWSTDGEEDNTICDTLTAAKSACERHHATGQW